MTRYFYARLAWDNLKKNSQTYLPYILTSTITVTMHYIIYSLTTNKGLTEISGSYFLEILLNLGNWVVAIFSVIFLLYTNSFVIKRRKKEFGLLNVLGLEKKHINKIVAFETLYVALFSIVGGLVGGIALSKLVFLALLKILNFAVPMGFEISGKAMGVTVILFSVIFAISSLYNRRDIRRSKTVELLRGGETGEREPKTRWGSALIGVICLSLGYYIALTTQSPISAITSFFYAVLLVIIGTYYLFIAGSIAFLKLLRANKSYYYKPNRFTAVSGMIYRMKQNAVGLANICILSTMLLVTISTTFALYIGFEDALKTMFPRDIAVMTNAHGDEFIHQTRLDLVALLDREAFGHDNVLDFRSLAFLAKLEKNTFLTDKGSAMDFTKDSWLVHLIPGEDYSLSTGEELALQRHEVLAYAPSRSFKEKSFSILGYDFVVKDQLASLDAAGIGSVQLQSELYLVVKDLDLFHEIYGRQLEQHGEYGSSYSYYFGFDCTLPPQHKQVLLKSMQTCFPPVLETRTAIREEAREELYLLYGGLFFVGIFLGFLFLLGTALIIYYKQISEGFDDRQKFAIMQQVGMTQDEVKKSIRNQVLLVFFLPLLTAGTHVAIAFKFMTRLLAVLGLTNVRLYVQSTFATFIVFSSLYVIFYRFTAKAYYKIVS